MVSMTSSITLWKIHIQIIENVRQDADTKEYGKKRRRRWSERQIEIETTSVREDVMINL